MAKQEFEQVLNQIDTATTNAAEVLRAGASRIEALEAQLAEANGGTLPDVPAVDGGMTAEEEADLLVRMRATAANLETIGKPATPAGETPVEGGTGTVVDDASGI